MSPLAALLAGLKRNARDLASWRDLDYTGRQLLLRKLFTLPFLAVLPLMAAAGLAARLIRAGFGEALRERDLA